MLYSYLVCQQMIAVTNHITDDSFVFQQDSAPAHYVHTTAQLLWLTIVDFFLPELWPLQPRAEPHWSQDLGSHTAT